MPPAFGNRSRIFGPSVRVGSIILSEPARRILIVRGTCPSSLPEGGAAAWASGGGAASRGSSMPRLVYMRYRVAGLKKGGGIIKGVERGLDSGDTGMDCLLAGLAK
jgi:hypothetical protein